MPIEVTMPRLSDTMETGTVIKWNVKEGDTVSAGDVLADIETDKATMELQSYDDGKVAKILVGEGKSVDVGAKILVLAAEGEVVGDVDAGGQQAASPEDAGKQPIQGEEEAVGGADKRRQNADAAAKPDRPRAANGEAASHDRGRIFASPLARKIAEEEGLDLSTIEGSGPSNRIVKRDVEAALKGGRAVAQAPRPAASKAPSKAASLATPIPGPTLEAKIVELSNMRRTIAKRLVESKLTVPHYQVTVTARMDALLALRKQLNDQLESQGVKLSVNDFIVRACALAMHEHPYVNSRWVEKNNQPAIEVIADVNVGVAIALPEERGGGLVVATLRQADRMGLRMISQLTKELADKARGKGLSVEEMSDSTFTISNLGMYGVEHFTAIINPPNACILAVGAAVKKPVIENDEIVIGHEMQMTMSSDHRIVDGAMAAQYLNTVQEMLENPATLLV